MKAQDIIDLAVQSAGLLETPADSGVIFDTGKDIRKVIFGVDMEAAEMLIAKQLGVDAVITHHPKGGAPAIEGYKVMHNQIERMVEAGVPINKAQKVLEEKKEEVDRNLHVSNYDRAVSAARLLEMTFISIHSPADLLGETLVQDHLDRRLGKNPKAILNDLIEALMELSEYQKAVTKPKVRVGSEKSYVGKPFVIMAGFTNGGPKVAEAYYEAGVGTLVAMHMPENVIKAVKEQQIGNLVVAGHMASDSIGINRLIRVFERKDLQVQAASGVVDTRA